MSCCKPEAPNHHPLVVFLSVLFGLGAWVSINGLWVELPLLVSLPEGWALPSYLSVIIQIANIGPIVYSTCKVLRPEAKSAPFIYCVLAIGCLASFFLALFWDETSYIGGELHSTALLILVFFLALVDCTSSVLYLPYMALWKNIYLPFYSVGEGLSGLVPALVALAQGVGNSNDFENNTTSTLASTIVMEGIENYSGSDNSGPNFSVTVFFFILFGMMVASALAFVLLDNLPFIQTERAHHNPLPTFTSLTQRRYSSCNITNFSEPSKNISSISLSVDSHAQQPAAEIQPKLSVVEHVPHIESDSTSSLIHDENGSFRWPKRTLNFLLLTQLFAGLLSNGFLPSIQSYSCGPYGDTAYHLSATLSAFANPLAAVTTALVGRAKPVVIAVMLSVGTVIGMYIIAAAAMSPEPPLVGTKGGSTMIVPDERVHGRPTIMPFPYLYPDDPSVICVEITYKHLALSHHSQHLPTAGPALL